MSIMKSEDRRSTRRLTVRPASVADSAAIARVCLLTAYQGRSAETLVRHPELPSQVHALPYLHLPSGFGFVLVETAIEEHVEAESGTRSGSDSSSDFNSESKEEQQRQQEPDGNQDEKMTIGVDSENIVGYVVGTGETAQFHREADASWWPILRIKYPKNLIGTPLDRYFVGLIHRGARMRVTSGAPSASFHVNVIGKYKKHGCDRELVNAALQHLRRSSQDYRYRCKV